MHPAGRGAMFAAAFVVALPSTALADGIAWEALAAYGAIVLVPVLAFVAVVEATVMARALRVPWRGLWRPSLRANLWSGLAGFPVSVGNAVLAHALSPGDLHRYFSWFPWIAALGYLNQLGVTLLVEAIYWRRRLPRPQQPGTHWRSGLLAANLLTYLVLCPLHYARARPDVRGIGAFTATSEWAAMPATEIYFLREPDAHLMRVRSDGTQPAELVAEPVTNYRVSGNGEVALARMAGDSSLRRLRIDARGGDLDQPPEPASDAAASPFFGPDESPTDRQRVDLGKVRVWVYLGLSNRLHVARGHEEIVLLSVNPGFWFRFPQGWVLEPCILANGHEVLFSWRNGIYLLSLDSRRVGKLASGRSYTVIQDAFERDDAP